MRNLPTFILTLLFVINSAFAQDAAKNDKDLSLKDLAVTENSAPLKEKAIIGKGDSEIFKKTNYLTAALVLGALLTAKEGKATEEHKALGAAAGAIFTAQTLLVKPVNGPTKWSDIAYYAATPLLMLAPILGGKRAGDIDHGKASTGLVKNHKGIASAGAIGYLLSVTLWSFNF